MTTKPERRWPLWPWLVLTLAGVGITVVAAVVGTVVASDADEAPVGAPATVTVTAVEIETSTVTRTVSATAPAGPVTVFDDGLHDVGVDVLAGTFRTDGPDGSNSSGCYWSHIGPDGDVIRNGMLNEPGSVTVNDGDRIDTAGCQPWRRQD